MSGRVAQIDTFIVTLPRDTPYLGPLGPGETVNGKGYIVRRGNGTIYPTVDRSAVVRVTAADGSIGWGETYGICAPRAVCEIVDDLLAPVVVGQEADEVERIWDDLYGLMRVRGSFGGFYVDAIAAIDIALWDLRAKRAGEPLWRLLGPRHRDRVPSYLSGLPAATIHERVDMALEWRERGHSAFKFAAVVSHDGVVEEFAQLRDALGADADIMVDLHWKYTAKEALALIDRLSPFAPRFVEAPVKPEDVAGLAAVAQASAVPIAAGEEWHTDYEARQRLDAGGLSLIQPEMGHTGVTQFRRICTLAAAHGVNVAPHATIGTGIFLAASLHTSAIIPNFWRHEWQHSVFENNLALLSTDMAADADGYQLPNGLGLGVEPSPAFWSHAEAVTSYGDASPA